MDLPAAALTVGVALVLVIAPASRLWSQTDSGGSIDAAAMASAILRDAAEAIAKHGLRPEPAAQIASKALRELFYRLGEDESAAEALARLPDEEALRAFGTHIAAISPEHGNAGQLAEQALALYVRTVDEYGAYIESATYTLASRLDPDTGAGVGISLVWRSGEFFCHPMPGSPAERAGVVKGDRLISVGGRDVTHTSLIEIGVLARGEPGTQVELGIRRAYGRMQTLTVTRETQTTPWVLVERDLEETLISVRRIEPGIVDQMSAACAEASRGGNENLTLDFRGCPGGNFDAAIDLASMFLPEGTPIATMMERERRLDFHAKAGPRVNFRRLTILQDSGTGSAAELFIACLFENLGPEQVVTHSERTFGKAAVLSSIPLASGGRLQITSGMLYAPSGRTWERAGLLPSLANGGQIFAPDHPSSIPPLEPAAVGTAGAASPQPVGQIQPPQLRDDNEIIEITPVGKGTGRF